MTDKYYSWDFTEDRSKLLWSGRADGHTFDETTTNIRSWVKKISIEVTKGDNLQKYSYAKSYNTTDSTVEYSPPDSNIKVIYTRTQEGGLTPWFTPNNNKHTLRIEYGANAPYGEYKIYLKLGNSSNDAISQIDECYYYVRLWKDGGITYSSGTLNSDQVTGVPGNDIKPTYGRSRNITVGAYPQLNGYRCDRWTDSSGSTTYYAGQTIYNTGKSIITLYPHWVKTHSITYYSIVGNAPSNIEYETDSQTEATTFGNAPTPPANCGWEFVHWAVRAAGSSGDYLEIQPSQEYTLNVGEYTATAVWKRKIQYQLYSGRVEEVDHLLEPTTTNVMVPDDLTLIYPARNKLNRPGYELRSWTYDGVTNPTVIENIADITSQIIVNANWNRLADSLEINLFEEEGQYKFQVVAVQDPTIDTLEPDIQTASVTLGGVLRYAENEATYSSNTIEYGEKYTIVRPSSNDLDDVDSNGGLIPEPDVTTISAVANDVGVASAVKSVTVFKLYHDRTVFAYAIKDSSTERYTFTSLPGEPYPENGYNFVGWGEYDSPIKSDNQRNPDYVCNSQVTVVATSTSSGTVARAHIVPIWARYRSQITYDMGAGASEFFSTYENFTASTTWILTGLRAPSPKTSSVSNKQEYLFQGWVLDGDNNTVYPPTTQSIRDLSSTADHTLKAVWTQFTHGILCDNPQYAKLVTVNGANYVDGSVYADGVEEECVVNYSFVGENLYEIPVQGGVGYEGWVLTYTYENTPTVRAFSAGFNGVLPVGRCTLEPVTYAAYVVTVNGIKGELNGDVSERRAKDFTVGGLAEEDYAFVIPDLDADNTSEPDELRIEVLDQENYTKWIYIWSFQGQYTDGNGHEYAVGSTIEVSANITLHPVYSCTIKCQGIAEVSYYGGGRYTTLTNNVPNYDGETTPYQTETYYSDESEGQVVAVTEIEGGFRATRPANQPIYVNVTWTAPLWGTTPPDLNNCPTFKQWEETVGNNTATYTGQSASITAGAHAFVARWQAECVLTYAVRQNQNETAPASWNGATVLRTNVILDQIANGGQYSWATQTFTIIEDLATKQGYVVYGWTPSLGGIQSTYYGGSNGSSTIEVAAGQNVTLYPYALKEYTYRLIYHAETITGSESEVTYTTVETSHTFTVNAQATMTNYVFRGWATSETANEVRYITGQTVVANVNSVDPEPIHLYAIFSPNYTIRTEYYKETERISLNDSTIGVQENIAYANLGAESTTKRTVTVQVHTPALNSEEGYTQWTYNGISYDPNYDYSLSVDVPRYDASETVVLKFYAVLRNDATIRIVVYNPQGDGEVYNVMLTKEFNDTTPEVYTNTLQTFFAGKEFHPVSYTLNEGTSVNWVRGNVTGISREINREYYVYLFSVNTEYNAYEVSILKGNNPNGSSSYWTVDMEYYYDGAQVRSRFKAPNDPTQTELKLRYIAPLEYSTLQTNGYMFSGLAESLAGDVVYPVDMLIDKMMLNGLPLPNGASIELYAKWGIAVSECVASYQTENNRLTATLTIVPAEAANKAIKPMYKQAGVYTKLTETASIEPKLISQSLAGNIWTIVIEYQTSTTSGSELMFEVQGWADDNNTHVNPTVVVGYTRILFRNDSWDAQNTRYKLGMLLPSVVHHLTYADSAEELAETNHRKDVSLVYSAVANGFNHTFVGWTANVDAFQKEEVDEGDVDEILTELTLDPLHGDYVLYPMWRMSVRFNLNGGTWNRSVSEERYAGTYTAYTDSTPVTITELTAPTHPTKKFLSWAISQFDEDYTQEENSVQVRRAAGRTLITAQWCNRNMEWKWGSGQIVAVGKHNLLAIPQAGGGVLRGTLYLPRYTWMPGDDTICFNTVENMPSHVALDEFEPDLGAEYGYVYVGLRQSGPAVIWGQYYKLAPGQNAVDIPCADIPEFIFKMVSTTGIENVDVTPVLWYTDSEGQAVPITPVNGYYHDVPVSAGTETRLYPREGYYESTEPITAGEEGPEYVVCTPITVVSQGMGFATVSRQTGAGNTTVSKTWTVVANDVGYDLHMDIEQELKSAEVYSIDKDPYGTYFFREIFENWLRAVPDKYAAETRLENGENVTVDKSGEVRISDRAKAGDYAVIFRAYESNPLKEILYVILLKIIDKDIDAPLCKLVKRTSPSSIGEELYLSTPTQKNLALTDVRWKRRAQLVQSPILTKSSQFNYIIDLGNLEYISVNIARTSPDDPDDDSMDVSQWTNRKWLTQVKTYFDQWQNANYNKEGRRSGGYNLILDPLLGYKCFPKLDKNVFLASPLDIDYGRVVSLRLEFLVASMLGRNAIETKVAKFHYKTVNGSGNEVDKTLEIEYYANMLVAPEIPADATINTVAWYTKIISPDGTPVVHWFEPGQEIIGQMATYNYDNERVLEFTALCGTNVGSILIRDVAPNDTGWVIAASKIKEVMGLIDEPMWINCIAVGGGGGGGSSTAVLAIDSGDPYLAEYYIGGGGGSGHVGQRTKRILKVPDLRVLIGKGGDSEKDGEFSMIEMDHTHFLTVNGGNAGQMRSAGKGGSKGGENTSYTGALPRHWGHNADIKGSNGEPNANRDESSLVRGGSGTSTIGYIPGSGGGAAQFAPVSVTSNGRWFEPTQNSSIRPLGNIGVIYSVGGSMEYVPIPNAGNDIQIAAQNKVLESTGTPAKYGGGGCSKLNKPDHSVGESFVNTIIGLGRYVASAAALVTGNGSYNINKETMKDAVRISSDGNKGADGVAIIEFITIDESNL